MLQREIGGSTITNEPSVHLIKRSSRAFLRNSSVGSNLNGPSGIPEEDTEDSGTFLCDHWASALRSLGRGPRVIMSKRVLMVDGELISSVPKFQQVQRNMYSNFRNQTGF